MQGQGQAQRFAGRGLKRWPVRCSLGTSNLHEANDKARTLEAEWPARFAALRNEKPQPVDLGPLREMLLVRLMNQFDRLDALIADWPRARRVRELPEHRGNLDEWRLALVDNRVPVWAEAGLNEPSHRVIGAPVSTPLFVNAVQPQRRRRVAEEASTGPYPRLPKFKADSRSSRLGLS